MGACWNQLPTSQNGEHADTYVQRPHATLAKVPLRRTRRTTTGPGGLATITKLVTRHPNTGDRAACAASSLASPIRRGVSEVKRLFSFSQLRRRLGRFFTDAGKYYGGRGCAVVSPGITVTGARREVNNWSTTGEIGRC